MLLTSFAHLSSHLELHERLYFQLKHVALEVTCNIFIVSSQNAAEVIAM